MQAGQAKFGGVLRLMAAVVAIAISTLMAGKGDASYCAGHLTPSTTPSYTMPSMPPPTRHRLSSAVPVVHWQYCWRPVYRRV